MYVHTCTVFRPVSHRQLWHTLCAKFTSLIDPSCLLPPFLSLSQVEVTKFEDLEETHAEVKLKQTLWQSQKDWATDYDTWLTVRLQY